MKKVLFSLLIAVAIAGLSLAPVYAEDTDTSGFTLDATDDVTVDSITITTEEGEEETDITGFEADASDDDITLDGLTLNDPEDEDETTTTTLNIIIDDGSDDDTATTTIDFDITIDMTTTTTTSSTIEIETTDTTGGDTTTNTQEETEDLTDYSVSDEEIQNTIDALLDYFRSQQEESGQIIDGPTSDWLMMSFGAAEIYGTDVNEQGTSLSDYMETYDLTDPAMELNICATYPRHYLALRATGLEDSSMIERITSECVTDDTYGEYGINDDVFALFALLSSGASHDSEIVQVIVSTILEDQTEDGAFTWAGYASPDITGAAMNALTYAQDKGVNVEETVYNDAIDYLKTQQLTDGGWGFGSSDILTTSWTMMGLNARNESQADWMTEDHKSPWHVLTEKLHDDGYYESSWVPGAVDWFGTKHAVPALAGSSWPITLDTVANTITPPRGSSGSSYRPRTTTSTTIDLDTTTTTLDITTTTLDMVTTTEDIVLEEEVTTTTPTVHLDPIDLWFLEQEQLAQKEASTGVPADVLGAKIEYTVTPTPDTDITTPTVVVEQTPTVDEEEEEKPEETTPDTIKIADNETDEAPMIDMKDIRNIIITIVVFVIGFAALKFFKILV